jgi:hypothetical protein
VAAVFRLPGKPTAENPNGVAKKSDAAAISPAASASGSLTSGDRRLGSKGSLAFFWSFFSEPEPMFRRDCLPEAGEEPEEEAEEDTQGGHVSTKQEGKKGG